MDVILSALLELTDIFREPDIFTSDLILPLSID